MAREPVDQGPAAGAQSPRETVQHANNVTQLKLYRRAHMSTERLTLTMRTSWLSEYRTPAGTLTTFEIAGSLTSFGMLCATLAQIPGVEFAELRPPARFVGPARMRFKGTDYELTMEHLDYRVTVLNPAGSAPTEELLTHLKELFARRARYAQRQSPAP